MFCEKIANSCLEVFVQWKTLVGNFKLSQALCYGYMKKVLLLLHAHRQTDTDQFYYRWFLTCMLKGHGGC